MTFIFSKIFVEVLFIRSLGEQYRLSGYTKYVQTDQEGLSCSAQGSLRAETVDEGKSGVQNISSNSSAHPHHEALAIVFAVSHQTRQNFK